VYSRIYNNVLINAKGRVLKKYTIGTRLQFDMGCSKSLRGVILWEKK
jgi:hypothetical protein